MNYQDFVQATKKSSRPLDYRKEQHEYFDAVANILPVVPQQDAVVAVIEADTGIGKAAGYLGVLGLDAAISGHQSVVSTFTRQLRDQIVEEEADRIITAVHEMTGKTIRIERWLGQNSYISISRIADEIIRLSNLPTTTPEDIQKLRAWSDFAINVSPLIEDAEDQGGLTLPDGVVAEDICVNSSCPKAERAPYVAARDKAVDADILVVTHALSCLDALTGGKIISARRDGRTLVIDEAHKLPDACDGILVYRQTFHQQMTSSYGQSIQQEAYRLLSLSKRKAMHVVASDPMFKTLIDLCTLAMTQPEFEGMSQFVKGASSPNGIVKAIISRSPTADSPALTASSVSPARVIRRLFKQRTLSDGSTQRYYDHLLITGATLEPHLLQEMSLLKTLNAALSFYGSTAFEPLDFADQEYVLAIKRSVPDPMIDVLHAPTNEMVRSVNPLYLDHLENLIQKAHLHALEMEGGSHRTLVLVPSFNDVAAIAQRMDAAGRLGDHVILHTPGHLLAPLLEQYRATPNAILISPSAWEGVDLPAMVQSLVIGRIPFEPPSHVKKMFLSNLFALDNSTFRAAAKLRQGIGRSTRRQRDRSLVWIADPRFPRPTAMANTMGLTGLGLTSRLPPSIIPRRFRKKLATARVVGVNGV